MDKLAIEFDPINGVSYVGGAEITSRTYEGIIAKCAEHIRRFWDKVGDRTIMELVNGYNPWGKE